MAKRTAPAVQAVVHPEPEAAPQAPTSAAGYAEHIELPPDLLDDSGGGGGGGLPPLIDHDEFRQLVMDVADSRDAVCVLSALLRGSPTGLPDAQVCNGLGTLLEAADSRLRLALETLGVMAIELDVRGP